MINTMVRLAFFTLVTLTIGSTGLRAEEKSGLPADNKIYAQKLVNKVFAANAQILVSAGIHAAAPGSARFTVIASTLNIIGKESDPNDVEVATFARTMITPIPKQSRLGVMLPLRDRLGKVIGCLAFSFRYHEGDDQVKSLAAATVIRDNLAREIPSAADLFVPAS